MAPKPGYGKLKFRDNFKMIDTAYRDSSDDQNLSHMIGTGKTPGV